MFSKFWGKKLEALNGMEYTAFHHIPFHQAFQAMELCVISFYLYLSIQTWLKGLPCRHSVIWVGNVDSVCLIVITAIGGNAGGMLPIVITRAFCIFEMVKAV